MFPGSNCEGYNKLRNQLGDQSFYKIFSSCHDCHEQLIDNHLNWFARDKKFDGKYEGYKLIRKGANERVTSTIEPDQVIETIKLQVHHAKICTNDPLINIITRISELTKVRVNSEGYKLQYLLRYRKVVWLC